MSFLLLFDVVVLFFCEIVGQIRYDVDDFERNIEIMQLQKHCSIRTSLGLSSNTSPHKHPKGLLSLNAFLDRIR